MANFTCQQSTSRKKPLGSVLVELELEIKICWSDVGRLKALPILSTADKNWPCKCTLSM